MADLGSWGEEPDVEEHTFLYFGQRFTVNPEFGQLDLLDWIESVSAVDEESLEAVAAAKDLMRAVFVEFDEVWALAKAKRQTSEQLMGVAMEVVSAIAERPTQRSSASSDGPATTEQKSEPVLSKRARRLKAQHEADGRPDLALVVLEAAQAS